MLMQALGTTHVLGVMTAAQIVIFTLFVTFYLPCMATLASMMRELGWRLTLAASTALLALAMVVSLAARGVMLLFLARLSPRPGVSTFPLAPWAENGTESPIPNDVPGPGTNLVPPSPAGRWALESRDSRIAFPSRLAP